METSSAASIMKMKLYNICFQLPSHTNGMGFGLSGLGIPKPRNMSNIFWRWLNGIPKHFKPLILVGAAALCWSIQLCRNVVVFDNKQSSFLQVIFLTTHWLRMWTILQWHTSQDNLVAASHFFGTGDQGLFCPSAWVAVQSQDLQSLVCPNLCQTFVG